MITRDGAREPRLQVNQVDGIPFYGKDVERLAPGAVTSFDETVYGYPVESLREIPDGEYWVQALVSVYSEFKRADGHTVWMHDDRWEGQHWNTGPGNFYSAPQKIRLDASKGYKVSLVADQEIPPVQVPADNQYVKRFKMQSPMLTKFWGRPIYIGATVLLPKDYETSTISYPVLYEQGHFGLAAPMGFEAGAGRGGGRAAQPGPSFREEWLSENFPRMVVVTFQHPTPYYDDSYAVNSVNNGPYGDALLKELVPEIEKRFRVLHEPWARLLAGGSTGGWEAAALQIFYPDFFGGSWVYCPDPVSFKAYEGVDIYEDANAFFKQHEWYRVPTPNIRDTLAHVRLDVEQKNHFEMVAGSHGRSGHQLDVWESVFSPLGADGYYRPLIDQKTGVIDKEVANYWKEHYDLMYILQRDRATLAPKLLGKLHFFVGTMDTYQLNVGVEYLEAWMKQTEDPRLAGADVPVSGVYRAEFTYGDRKPHCWSGPDPTPVRIREMADYLLRHRPPGMPTPWYKY